MRLETRTPIDDCVPIAVDVPYDTHSGMTSVDAGRGEFHTRDRDGSASSWDDLEAGSYTIDVEAPLASFEDDTARHLCATPGSEATDPTTAKGVETRCGSGSPGHLEPRNAALLEVDFIAYNVMRHLAVRGVVDLVRLGVTSKSTHATFRSFLGEHHDVDDGVRCNQTVYRDIQTALEKERTGRLRPRCRVTDPWVGRDLRLSWCRILFRFPALFPYFPTSICLAFAASVFAFSLLQYGDVRPALHRVVLVHLMAYALLVGVTACYCFTATCLTSDAFLRGLAVLFHAFVLTQAVSTLTLLVVFFFRYKTMFLWLALSCGFSTWTIYQHAKTEFRSCRWRGNAITALAAMWWSVLLFLLWVKFT